MDLSLEQSLMLVLLTNCSVFALVRMMEMIILVMEMVIPVVIIPLILVACAQQMNSQVLFPASCLAVGSIASLTRVTLSRHRIVTNLLPTHNVLVHLQLHKV